MAKIVILLMLSPLFIIASGAQGGNNHNEESWLRNVSRGKETVRKLHFYVQDESGGPNATVWEVARSSITNGSFSFGQLVVIDDLITSGPEPTSNKLGRAQGLVTFADMHESAAIMSFNFVFSAGQYKGSTLSIFGRKSTLGKQHELPIVGGTGVFRMARGYSISDTYAFNSSTKHGVFEYTIYVTLVDQLKR